MKREEAAQVLKNVAFMLKDGTRFMKFEHEQEFREAYEMAIKALEQPGQDWIPVSEGMPKEREWVGTKQFGTTISDEVYVTFEAPNGERFVKHLSFQNGKVPSFKQREIDVWFGGATPVAWKPLPEPYQPDTK